MLHAWATVATETERLLSGTDERLAIQWTLHLYHHLRHGDQAFDYCLATRVELTRGQLLSNCSTMVLQNRDELLVPIVIARTKDTVIFLPDSRVILENFDCKIIVEGCEAVTAVIVQDLIENVDWFKKHAR